MTTAAATTRTLRELLRLTDEELDFLAGFSPGAYKGWRLWWEMRQAEQEATG